MDTRASQQDGHWMDDLKHHHASDHKDGWLDADDRKYL
jgi:hypothetical protein